MAAMRRPPNLIPDRPSDRRAGPPTRHALSHRGHGPLQLPSMERPLASDIVAARETGQTGFTLIELIVVVAIIAVLASAITLSVNAVGAPRQVEREARRFEALLALACERAETSGRDVGVHLGANRYGFSLFLPGGWRLETAGELREREMPRGLALDARRDGIVLELEAELPADPQLVCYASGELTPFALEVGAAANVPRYLVRGESDGSLEWKLAETL